MLTGETQAQRKDSWQDQEEKLQQMKFAKDLGLKLTTVFGLLNAANEDNDSNLDMEFGGDNAFEDS